MLQCQRVALASATTYPIRNTIGSRNRSSWCRVKAVSRLSERPVFSDKDVVLHSRRHQSIQTSALKKSTDYILGQGGYQYLTFITAAVGLGALFATSSFASVLLNTPVLTPEGIFGLRYVGGCLLNVTTMCYILRAAVSGRQQLLKPYQQMAFTVAVAMMIFCIGTAHYFTQQKIEMTVAFWISSIAELLPSVVFLRLYGILGIKEALSSIVTDVKSLFSPKNSTAALYAVLTLVPLFFAIGDICVPREATKLPLIKPVTNFGALMTRGVGASALVLGIANLILKAAADSGKFQLSKFNTLNLGAAISAATRCGIYIFMALSSTAANPASILTPFGRTVFIGINLTTAIIYGILYLKTK